MGVCTPSDRFAQEGRVAWATGALWGGRLVTRTVSQNGGHFGSGLPVFLVYFAHADALLAVCSLMDPESRESLLDALLDGASRGRSSLAAAALACPPGLLEGLHRRGLLRRSRLAVVAAQDVDFQAQVIYDILPESDLAAIWQLWTDLLEAGRACAIQERQRELARPREERSLRLAVWQATPRPDDAPEHVPPPLPTAAAWPTAKRPRAGP